LDLYETGIILRPVTAVTDDSPVVRHDTGVSVRTRSGLNDDVARGGAAYWHSGESAVMQEGITEERRAQDMAWLGSQHNPLIGRPREKEGHRQGAIRLVQPFT
jgi:hypothetical protein